ncbi:MULTISPECIES: hypothetical protein [Halococcus]|uniref:Uncharacterized protein n=1 Tax=Halococcus salifodinae DSM 8989 TaxID=1227456 RepID=M0MTJ9_9EURY|nr:MULTISPECIES: hypothetical protein [Halococcus]EMA48069.1 hypothetical protein C450_20376 [Halococcus salifodinae DSM 8989]
MTSAIDIFARAFNRMHRIDNPPVEGVCDFCSGPISAGDRVATYVNEADLGGYAQPYPGTKLYAHRTYCEECNRHHIIYPHEGTSELLLEATVQKDGTHTDWVLRESSPDDHGEPWDGHRAFGFVFGALFDGLAARAALREWTVGHEDVVDMIRLGGIDLREVFDENGAVIAPEEKQQRIQQQVLDHLTGVGLESHDDAFDRLQDEDRPGAFTCPECGAEAAYWAGVEHDPDCSSGPDDE